MRYFAYSLFIFLVGLPAWANDGANPAPASESTTTPAPAKSDTDTSTSTETKKPDAKSGAGKEKAFTGEALKVKNQLEVLFVASQKVNKAGEQDKARSTIDAGLDWERIAHDCLGAANWNKQSAANREQFKGLLKKVVSKTAYSRMDSFWTGNTTYRFQKIDVKGKEAVAKCKFNVKDDSVALEYYLEKKGDKWVIFDIAYDDLRYSENINEQISAFLKEGKFAGLIDKLKKRLDELENASEDDKKSSKKS